VYWFPFDAWRNARIVDKALWACSTLVSLTRAQ
jgi:hypothetical protein